MTHQSGARLKLQGSNFQEKNELACDFLWKEKQKSFKYLSMLYNKRKAQKF